MSVSADQFAKAVIAAGLSSAEEIKTLWGSLPAGQRPKDGETFAKVLIEHAKLTQFQASELLSGGATPLVLGDYVLLAKIGAGGMGQVFKAHHRRMKRVVAIKLLPTALTKDEAAVKRFEREVEAAAKLVHANIVVAHDAGHAKGQHFLVMEYVEGRDLSRVVANEGPLPIARAVDYIRQTAKGLAFAHGKGMVHRDIKPANLLLDQDGTVKILDMGLARFEDGVAAQEGLTKSGDVMGTVDYMAPEQAFDTRHADARADIYSLGCTLYRLLTGQNMYDGETLVQKLMAHQQKPIPSLATKRPGTPKSLVTIFEQMVAKKPADRFQTMADVEAALATLASPPPAASSSAKPEAESKLSSFLQSFTGNKPMPITGRVATVQQPRTSAKSTGELSPTISIASAQVTTEPISEFSIQQVAGMRPPRRPKFPWWRQPLLVVAGGVGGFLLLLAAIVFFVQTKDGLIRVEINDPEIEVAIKGTKIVLKQADQGKDVEVSPGEKTLVIRRGDFNFETDKLILKSKEIVTVRVERLASQVEVKQGDQVLGRKTLPPVWHGWPADAPKPAIAPFDAAQAKRHQDEWAKFLGVPVEYSNSIGMKFRLIPPGEFMMGSSESQVAEANRDIAINDNFWRGFMRSESPAHRVVLTRPIYVGATEVTQKQFDQVIGKNPSQFKLPNSAGKTDSGNYPVETISWHDASEFCLKLSQQERHKPLDVAPGVGFWPRDATGYRLPTEAEWEFACRAGTGTNYWIGDSAEAALQASWVKPNSGDLPHPVGERKANPFGLYDVHGNVWEWVDDWWDSKYYEQFVQSPAVDPLGGAAASCDRRVVRGGGFGGITSNSRSSQRTGDLPSGRNANQGFRVALTVDAAKAAIAGPMVSTPGVNKQPIQKPMPTAQQPQPAVAPFDATQARAHQEAWAKHLGTQVETMNSVGAKLVLIPPGEFQMGSTDEQVAAALRAAGELKASDLKYIESTLKLIQNRERPQHRVIITKPFLMGVTEVTVGQFNKFAVATGFREYAEKSAKESNLLTYFSPGYAVTDDSPAAVVSWSDAQAYCKWLSEQEKALYRLPTEAEWENACRAGTITRYSFGDNYAELEKYAWYNQNAGGGTHPVGTKLPNAFGLHDMHGNLFEWCQDVYDERWYEKSKMNDPSGPAFGSHHVLRGGGWFLNAAASSSTYRIDNSPLYRDGGYGFRCVREIDVSATTLGSKP